MSKAKFNASAMVNFKVMKPVELPDGEMKYEDSNGLPSVLVLAICGSIPTKHVISGTHAELQGILEVERDDDDNILSVTKVQEVAVCSITEVAEDAEYGRQFEWNFYRFLDVNYPPSLEREYREMFGDAKTIEVRNDEELEKAGILPVDEEPTIATPSSTGKKTADKPPKIELEESGKK